MKKSEEVRGKREEVRVKMEEVRGEAWSRKPMAESNGDKVTEFGNDILDSNRRVAYVYDGVKVLDKPRMRWTSGKRPANEPQVVNPIKKGGAK